MDKLKLLIGLFIASVCIFTYAQESERTIEYDFGIIPSDSIAHKVYEVKGEIVSAVSLCDCVDVQVDRGKNNSLINIKFNPEGYDGLTVQEVKLFSDNGQLITLKLRVYVGKVAKPDLPDNSIQK